MYHLIDYKTSQHNSSDTPTSTLSPRILQNMLYTPTQLYCINYILHWYIASHNSLHNNQVDIISTYQQTSHRYNYESIFCRTYHHKTLLCSLLGKFHPKCSLRYQYHCSENLVLYSFRSMIHRSKNNWFCRKLCCRCFGIWVPICLVYNQNCNFLLVLSTSSLNNYPDTTQNTQLLNQPPPHHTTYHLHNLVHTSRFFSYTFNSYIYQVLHSIQFQNMVSHSLILSSRTCIQIRTPVWHLHNQDLC